MLLNRIFCALAAAGLALGLAARAQAQDTWPAKPLKIIVPFPAGGSSDPPMRPRPEAARGAGAVRGGGEHQRWRRHHCHRPYGAGRARRGYTLGMAAVGTFCIAPHLYSSVNYDPLQSFTPITILGEYTNVLVVKADSPYNA